jgi:hypothetical protein
LVEYSNGRYVRVTLPQVKKMIREQGEVEISLCPKGRDVNHMFSTKMETIIRSEEDIENAIKKWFDFSGTTEHWYAIRVEDNNK